MTQIKHKHSYYTDELYIDTAGVNLGMKWLCHCGKSKFVKELN